jgi:hypothetical protein
VHGRRREVARRRRGGCASRRRSTSEASTRRARDARKPSANALRSEIGGREDRHLVVAALIWAALRFGQRCGTVAAGLTIWNASHLDAFVFHSVSHTDVNTQLFIGVAALTASRAA